VREGKGSYVDVDVDVDVDVVVIVATIATQDVSY
jgi:hypothetical protein